MDELAALPQVEIRHDAPATLRPIGDGRRLQLLSVRGLAKRYDDQPALDDVGFDILAGEVLGLIGPNGAGKTTLLEALAGVSVADAGDVRWQGEVLPRQQRSAVLFYIPDGLRPYP